MIKFFRLTLLTEDLFKKFIEKELNLNDQLAAIRSILASERTFLAYQRTALATLAAGLTLVQFFQNILFQIIGWLLVPIAILTVTIGFIRYRKTRRYIFQLEKDFAKEHRNSN